VSSNRVQEFRRAFASCLLVLLQVNLLGVAMLHWHGELPAPAHSPQVYGCEAPSSSASECNLPCTACQIVQNGAVQPADAAQVIPSSHSTPLARLLAPSFYRSEFSAISYGRAPPLV
jgi:hypothetical protein